MDWLELRSKEDFQRAIEHSLSDELKGILFFKHSTRCGISSAALRNLERTWNIPSDKCDVYMLDLLQHRDVSNLIAQELKVSHESPQAILIKGGHVLYHASHHSISVDAIAQHL